MALHCACVLLDTQGYGAFERLLNGLDLGAWHFTAIVAFRSGQVARRACRVICERVTLSQETVTTINLLIQRDDFLSEGMHYLPRNMLACGLTRKSLLPGGFVAEGL